MGDDEVTYERYDTLVGDIPVAVCVDCGSVVVDTYRDTHDRFHGWLDRVESDAFMGGGLIG